MITLEKGKVYRKKILHTDKYFFMKILSDVQKDDNDEAFVYVDVWDKEKKEWCGAGSPFYLREETLADIELTEEELEKSIKQ